MSTEIALKFKLSDFIAEYEEKQEALAARLDDFVTAGEALKMASTVHGTYGQERIEIGNIGLDTLHKNLRRSAWLALYEAPGVKIVMSAKDKKHFDQWIQNPPEFTIEEIKERFGDHILNPWANILRGLAEVFGDLDQSFKSHERCKVGVEGLPKRIIVTGFGGYSSHYGFAKLKDVFNAIASLRGEALHSEWELQKLLEKDGRHFWEERGLELRLFQNGNGHLHFSPKTLKDVNRALAEFYGDVLPDGVTAKPEKRQESTEVSKDLQYYPTPHAVVERVLDSMYIREPEIVLEPSCGCGRFLDGLRKRFPACELIGVEVYAPRVHEARRKGHTVIAANFLDLPPDTIRCDRVVMNPPFYGKHYAKHVEHALKFLKPGGSLHAVLPITAKTDHGIVAKMGRCEWSDLPVGSFRESGTNINTTVLTMRVAA